MNYHISPKAELLADAAAVKALGSAIKKPEVFKALDIAFQEYAFQLANTDRGEAADKFHKLQGADEFTRILRNLAEAPEKRYDAPDLNLSRNK